MGEISQIFNAHLPFSQRKAMSLDIMRSNNDLLKNSERPLTQVKNFRLKLGFICTF